MSLVEWLEIYVELKGLQELEGGYQTSIPGVWFYRSEKGNPRKPLVYQSGVLMLAQGHKNIYLDQNHVTYGPNDYLVVGVPLPLECEAIAEQNKPMLGISVHISHRVLLKLVRKIEDAGLYTKPSCDKKSCGLKSIKMSVDIQETCLRLARALCDDIESNVIGESIMEELVYRVLREKEGDVLFDLAHKEGHYSRVAMVLNKVHQEYSQNLSVNELAKAANMSVSAFHQAFRHVTMESPLQYIKKIRLNRARDLIQREGKKVNEAALIVGYLSASQFHREYKRLFKETPKEIQPL